MPYTQAQAYAGRAEVYDLTDDATAAESDYGAAIGLLEKEDVGKKENIAEKLIRELKIKVLQFHAEVCMKLGWYDKALEDYAKLAELGVDMTAENQKDSSAQDESSVGGTYVGRAEVNELTTANKDALADYEAASTALDTVDVEKITDVTEQMLEALKIKIYNACARLKAFFGQNEAAAADYTSALNSLDKLPEDTDVLDVKATKVVSYTGRADANAAQEKYEEVLPDYDALITLGEDKAADRDAILSAMSLAKSKAGDLHSSDSWLDEVNHTDYAASIQLTNAESVLKQAAELAQADGAKAYDKIKETLSTDEAKAAMQSLLARGYQLRYYDANGKMLAVYANETAWADVNMEENGTITAEALTAADPSAEDIGAVSLSKLYVYYGGCEGRSREGAGLWFILNPGKKDLTAESYTWKNDKPEGDFKQKEESKPVAAMESGTSAAQGKTHNWKTVFDAGTYSVSCQEGGTTVAYAIKFSDAYKAQFAEAPNASALIALYAQDKIGKAKLSNPISRVEETQNFIYIYVPKGTTMTDQRTGYSGPVVSGNESDGDLGMIFREENE